MSGRTTSTRPANAMSDPEDGHPLCCSVSTTNPPECSCWHEEIRTISRLRPPELPYDNDYDEAS